MRNLDPLDCTGAARLEREGQESQDGWRVNRKTLLPKVRIIQKCVKMKLFFQSLAPALCCLLSLRASLVPDGRNVCHNPRDPSNLICCSGWQQERDECTKPVCEGEQACLKDELCVYPGVCRCPPGFYGAHCKTRCPGEFWASDCRQVCPCYPNGRCHAVTGECTCNINRWGPLCQYSCKCARHGHCDTTHGNCSCDEGWWSPTCAKPCQCVSGGSVRPSCEQSTGRCQCHRGFWGLKCALTCSCYMSPCSQRTGVCECKEGWWGPSCDRRCNCDITHSRCDPSSGHCLCHPGYKGDYCNLQCEAGTFGSGCRMSCGYCKDNQHCAPADGACAACAPGWNGTQCDSPCPSGFFGDGCKMTCPRCRKNQPCDPQTGYCWKCDNGWTGPRCEKPCRSGTYGEACAFQCNPCLNGSCHQVTGKCICDPGFHGESCNISCPTLYFGLNCSSLCDCGEGVGCDPITGACPKSSRGAVIAAVLVPLFLLLLLMVLCCVCCGEAPVDSKDRALVAEGGLSVRMKYHVYSVIANIGAALPCVSDWSTGLPRVTVSHHDPELTFNHSFIEPPSCGWVTEGSSFESDEEEAEALYCVPPREDIPAVAGGEFQEMSSKCNMFLDPSGFSSEDINSPFNIPRTSSLAKAKRPSVSFAEGTRFCPKEGRSSGQEVATPSGHPRTKPKTNWGVLMVSALQGQVAKTGEENKVEDSGLEEKVYDQEVELGGNSEERDKNQTSPSGGAVQDNRAGKFHTNAHKRCHASASDSQVTISSKVTTVYVTVGKAGRPVSKAEPSSEGPVQSMLRRLGSLQRQKDQDSDKGKLKVAEGITKPPRRKLGARVNLWEQGENPVANSSIAKPIRRKRAQNNPLETAAGDQTTSAEGAKRPLSFILNSVPEVAPVGPREEEEGERAEESNYLTVGPAGDAQSQVIVNDRAVGDSEEPCYENVLVKHI
ncbi:scavenger receptor class F member 1 [Eucyclogobius newberryi]|uniref:scavenger receptor class F member 1 n=1 Tax=Eucyclogobius newberryi TaxID=166745 RepID=UPI003B5AAC97